MPKVSVIIPCFNLGKYINEAIDSVLKQTFRDFEIIVVNDGSTDAETISILNNLDNPAVKLISTTNQGLANARNNGIAKALGEYILPLDADDKIASTYLEKAVEVLDQNKNTGIVYCQAEFFGVKNFKWDLPDYELSRILIDNLIFASALFRKEDWKTIGGYKSEMRHGWEDYEFWLSIIELKREVYRLPEHLFFYRTRHDSMASVMSKQHLLYSHKEIVKNHKDLYINNIQYIFEFIYNLRDNITEKEQQRIAKDTHIHNLNLETNNLNLKISSLNLEINNLNSKLSSPGSLIKLLCRSIAEKLSFKDRAED